MKWLLTFEVSGKGGFPLDMLRHDRCWPTNQRDVEAMLQTNNGPGVIMSLTMCVPAKSLQPTVLRWLSFGWQVNTKSYEYRRATA